MIETLETKGRMEKVGDLKDNDEERAATQRL
jgi:hypothetical protein